MAFLFFFLLKIHVMSLCFKSFVINRDYSFTALYLLHSHFDEKSCSIIVWYKISISLHDLVNTNHKTCWNDWFFFLSLSRSTFNAFPFSITIFIQLNNISMKLKYNLNKYISKKKSDWKVCAYAFRLNWN